MPLQLGGVIVHNDSVERITLATRGMTHKYLHLLAVSSSRGEHHGHCERCGQRGHCGQQAVPTHYCSHEPPSTSVRPLVRLLTTCHFLERSAKKSPWPTGLSPSPTYWCSSSFPIPSREGWTR